MPDEKAALLALAAQLGVEETNEVTRARAAFIVAYRTAHRPEYMAALKKPGELSGLPGIMSDDRRYVGFMLAQAAMWYETGDVVQYWREIIFTLAYALKLDIARQVMAVLGPIIDAAAADMDRAAEFLQAVNAHEQAVGAYLELEDSPEPNLADGLKHWRVAQCYLWLLEAAHGAPDLDLGLISNVVGNVLGELRFAIGHLSEYPEQILIDRAREHLRELTVW